MELITKGKKDKIQILVISAIIYFILFLMTGYQILPFELGSIILVLLYTYINFNVVNLFFTSKRTTFKVYFFMIFDLIYFFTSVTRFRSFVGYLLIIAGLRYLILDDEGRENIKKIDTFLLVYTICKILFILSLIAFSD